MRIDCHVHTCAFSQANGKLSAKLRRSLPFKFLDWTIGLGAGDAEGDRKLEAALAAELDAANGLDAAAILAFDAVHEEDGTLNDAETHLYVKNDYVIGMVRRHPKMLFGASIHPYRKDAVPELERCAAAGAVLVKWLPITQKIDPSSPKCYAFYDALAALGMPLLSHTGGERTLPRLNNTQDPMLLMPALRRGVTVIAAHCGTRSFPFEHDYTRRFARMAVDHERFFGDTAALNLPFRAHGYKFTLDDPRVRTKLIHGSDFPIMPVPPLSRLGWHATGELMARRNWLQRDVEIKKQLGFDDAYWRRAANVLRLSPRA